MTTYSILCAAPSPDGRVQCTNGKGHAGKHTSMLGFLRWSDSEAPHGSYTRHGSPDYADGGMAAAAIEEEAEGDLWAKATPGQGSSEWWMARWQEAADRANACGLAAHMWKETARRLVTQRNGARRYGDFILAARDRATDQVIREQHRAERAEQERDELRQTRRRLLGKVDQLEVKLRDSGSGGEPRALTAREHLQLAWEAAHVPEGETIPAGAAYLMRSNRTGRVVTPTGDWAAPVDLPASETWGERRLLDPPTPSRPDGAEELARLIADADVDEWDCDALAARLHADGVRVVTEEER